MLPPETLKNKINPWGPWTFEFDVTYSLHVPTGLPKMHISPPYDDNLIFLNFPIINHACPGTSENEIHPQGPWTFELYVICFRQSSDLQNALVRSVWPFSIFLVSGREREKEWERERERKEVSSAEGKFGLKKFKNLSCYWDLPKFEQGRVRKGNEAGTCKNLVREKEGGSMGLGNVWGRGREREYKRGRGQEN